MNEKSDPMMTAVNEVSLVAEEIKALQQRIQQYAESSKRLDGVCGSLQELSRSVSKMQELFGFQLGKSSEAAERLGEITASVERLTDSIPSVVQRIEASDIAKASSEFTDSLAQLREIIATSQQEVGNTQAALVAERRQTEATLREMGERTDKAIATIGKLSSDLATVVTTAAQHSQLLQLMNQVLMQNVATPIAEQTRALAAIQTRVEEFQKGTEKSVDGMAKLSSQLLHGLAEIRTQLQFQGEQIEVMKSKKGFFLK